MALTANSTIDEIVAEYVNNAGYDVNNSLAQAKLFIVACRILLVKRPQAISTDGVSTTFSVASLQQDLKRAQSFLSARTSGQGRVRSVDISDIDRR